MEQKAITKEKKKQSAKQLVNFQWVDVLALLHEPLRHHPVEGRPDRAVGELDVDLLKPRAQAAEKK